MLIEQAGCYLLAFFAFLAFLGPLMGGLPSCGMWPSLAPAFTSRSKRSQASGANSSLGALGEGLCMSDIIPEEDEFSRIHREKYLALCTARGIAMNAYAGIEQHLAALLATFGQMPEDVAFTILYRIVNSRSRLEILDKLKKRKIGGEYALFWNSLIAEIKKIDQRRNELAHWHADVQLESGYRPNVSRVVLKPPSYGYGGEAELTIEKCEDFAHHCAIIADTMNMFWAAMEKRPPPTDALLDIFQRPIVYPLLEGDPLSLTLEKLYSPPRSSQA